MSKRLAVDQETKQAMVRMGELIAECRGKRGLRKIALPSGIQASQLQYIEQGVMAPTAEVYPKLLNELNPNDEQRTGLDRLYMAIRKTPPPDVCNLIAGNPDFVPLLRALGDAKLTKKEINALITSLAQKKIKGETNNG